MPFRAERRHRFRSADVRHLDVLDESLVGSKAYAITILEDYSRFVRQSARPRREPRSSAIETVGTTAG
ncbi:hypothetical protein GBA65_18225 [Rubrobacter marinus]|uniref:Uncharacterized protein n=1 Tax=Rubrobacter marinus TaxID=2653852 RepID=A0A6G8Q113_9ACTN|nr:hypothetical protein [Rubrobacter marinus]QIN80135.1 hypothetical protein GBA65_18225 [Rubrobacter marinus]